MNLPQETTAGSGNQNIPKAVLDLVCQMMEPGEQIDWMAQPEPPFVFRGRAWAFFLLGLCLTPLSLGMIAACFIEGSVWPDPSVLFGIVQFALKTILWGVITTGAFLGLTAPYWAHKSIQIKAQNTLYVITNRRVIVVNGGVADEVIEDCFTYEGPVLGIEDAWYCWYPNRRPLPVVNSYPPEMLNRIQSEGRTHVYFHYVKKYTYRNHERVEAMAKTGFRFTPDIETAVSRLNDLTAAQTMPPIISPGIPAA
jgi:hypothetical protein